MKRLQPNQWGDPWEQALWLIEEARQARAIPIAALRLIVEQCAKFEADVLERLNRLECTTEPPPAFEVEPGPTLELDLSAPLCVGDGLPNVKGYEPEVESVEEQG